MNRFSEIFGAKAIVFLKYKGTIGDIAQLLSSKLTIPEFRIESDQDPPHKLLGLCETLGFELWLNYSDDLKRYDYELQIETTLKVEESFKDQVYDISSWFAREVSFACKLTSFVIDKNGGHLYFINGKPLE